MNIFNKCSLNYSSVEKQDCLETIKIVNKICSKFLELWKTELIKDFNKLILDPEFRSNIIQIVPELDLIFKILPTIIKHITDNNLYSNIKDELQQIFHNSKDDLYCYLNDICTSLPKLLKKHWLKILNLIEIHFQITIDHKKIYKLNCFFDKILEFVFSKKFLLFQQKLVQSITTTDKQQFLRLMEKFINDLISNQGYLKLTEDRSLNFQIGKNLAATPGKVVFKNDLMELIRYTPNTIEVDQIPILFVPPFINKYYILDLSKDNSLVKWMIEQGLIVYMISWINPKKILDKKFSDYMINGSLKAIDLITNKNQNNKIHLAGYCIGGTLLSCTVAYMQKLQDHRTISVSYFMSLVDFSDLGKIGSFINNNFLYLLEKFVNYRGYLDGKLLQIFFYSIKETDFFWTYLINNYLSNNTNKQTDLSFWNSDLTNLPAKMYIFYLKKICLENKLKIPNALKLNRVSINLNDVQIPTFCLGGKTDHITIWEAIYNGSKLYGGSVEFVLSSAGHVKGMINPPKDHKYLFYTNSIDQKFIKHLTAQEWLENAKIHAGSWWPYWRKWLQKYNTKKIYTKDLRSDLEDLYSAPGIYVKE